VTIDWDYVKKTTLWHYEPLIKKLHEVLAYDFVREHYHHSMDEAASFAGEMRQGYVQNDQPADFLLDIVDHFKGLGRLGVKDYQDLVERVDTQPQCKTFIQETSFSFKALVDTLGYLLRWALPFKCRLKKLVDPASEAEMTTADELHAHKIRFNLDLLEAGRSRPGRRALAQEAGISVALLLQLVHRADMTRLAYVRGKTVLHLCGGGYDNLAKLAAADLDQIEADMSAYYQSLGKSLSDFKAVIPLGWMVGGARVLPKVMDA
jgi:hypothetical protein